MPAKLIEIIRLISTAGALIPLIIGWLRYKSASKVQKILAFAVTASFLADATGSILLQYRINNLAVYNIYALVSFNLIWYLYQSEIAKLKNRFIWSLQIGLNIFAVINALFIQSLDVFNSNTLVTFSLTYLSLATYSFYELLKEIKYTRLEKNPIFWVNTGIIIYYSGTLILFLLSNQINNASPDAYTLHLASWGLNSFFNLLLITANSIALWVRPAK